jgi:hypothetical protein
VPEFTLVQHAGEDVLRLDETGRSVRRLSAEIRVSRVKDLEIMTAVRKAIQSQAGVTILPGNGTKKKAQHLTYLEITFRKPDPSVRDLEAWLRGQILNILRVAREAAEEIVQSRTYGICQQAEYVPAEPRLTVVVGSRTEKPFPNKPQWIRGHTR